MPRIALGLSYDGTAFVGWQAQAAGRSIEQTLSAAVSHVANEPVAVESNHPLPERTLLANAFVTSDHSNVRRRSWLQRIAERCANLITRVL